MPYSSPTKTRWSSDSDRRGPVARQPAAPAPLIELNDVSLRFVNYADKQYSLKRAALDLVLRRESAAPSSEFWALREYDISDQARRPGRRSSAATAPARAPCSACLRGSIRRPSARCRFAAASPP